MAESGSETEIKGVKEALGTGQQLLQKLYLELDKEREASASAASEALSMILRLQEEKAAMKMEASQYQRMAEEKICHAEEHLTGLEEMILQKEMEIASLEFQVQAYRYKLLSLGCPDLGPCEPKFADQFLLQKKDLVSNGEFGVSGKVRRARSLPPPTQFDELYDREDAAETETYEILKPDCYHPSIEERPNHCSWEQIEMLDEQIKEISDSKGSSEDRSESLNVGFVVCPSSIQDKPDELRGVKPDVSPKCSSSSSVQDIFEIPEANLDFKACQNRIQLQKKLIFEGENGLGNPDPVPTEPFKLHHKDEQTRAKKASSCKNQKNKSSKLRRGKAIGSGTIPARQQIDEIVAESQPFQQLCHIIEKLEQNKTSARQEITGSGVGELLKEIQEQLNSIQSEMKSLQIKQGPAQKNSLFDLLQEAMLHCWF
ncbi:uncharacterized protein LOC120070540 [Benincasa hispida]|uniref:uncharacterized protein LOC120070540 n=1 Tax=Benincasa hispida TaxID=102211 RepID=UPI001901307D|nr:uncharacterized protein LOC120070540 [Benincasa hispida]